MIDAVIIDDEPKSVFTLKNFIESHCPDVRIVGSAGNAVAGKELVEQVKPQLALLDIQMPLGTGFDMLRSLPVIDFEIIFITAYNEYAINAFRFSAVDYLLKPIRITQLMEAIDKAVKRINDKAVISNYELLIRNIEEQSAPKQKLTFNDRGEQVLVSVNEIMYLIADGHYTYVHTERKIFLASKNLKDFEGVLPQDAFCRIHHGHIVNINFIAKVLKGRGGSVQMKDGKTLEIAIRRKEEFMKMLKR